MEKSEEEWASKDVFCCFGNWLGCFRDLWSPLQLPWALPTAVVIHTITRQGWSLRYPPGRLVRGKG